MSQPDLFVVCKNCGSEVSPYVTECPYCGQRVRKRAPKIDRSGGEAEPKRRARAKLPRLRAEEIVGIAPDARPYATMALIAVSLVISVVWASGEVFLGDLGGVVVPVNDDVWRFFTTPFVHDSLGYQFAALLGVGIFGTLLERRFGPVPVVLIFLLAGAAGAAARGRARRAATARRPDRLPRARGERGCAGPAVRLARGRSPRRPPR